MDNSDGYDYYDINYYRASTGSIIQTTHEVCIEIPRGFTLLSCVPSLTWPPGVKSI